MNKINFLLVMLFVFSRPSFANSEIRKLPSKKTSIKNYPTAIDTLTYRVLSLNEQKGLIGFKHEYVLRKLRNEVGNVYKEPYKCSYAGQKIETSGVIFGIYDLKKDRVTQWFPVYWSTHDQKECQKLAESKGILQQAKNAFTASGLSIKRKPLGWHTIKSYDDFIINFCKKRHQIKITHSRSTDSNLTSYAVTIDGKEQWQRSQKDSFNMASGGKFGIKGAIVLNCKVSFLEKFTHQSNGVGSNFEIFSFTKFISP